MRLKGLAEELRKEKVRTRRADINIGKRGIHRGLIEEIKKELEIKGCIKIKILKNARSIISEEDIVKLAEEVGSTIIDKRGYTYILISKKLFKISQKISPQKSYKSRPQNNNKV